MAYIAAILASYLLGSVPFGFLLSRWFAGADLRKIGSGGTGATNAARAGGMRLFVATWALDMAKTIAAVLVGRHFCGPAFGALCGLVSVIGHCFPIWLGFRGGKGVSGMFGFMLAVNPLFFAVCGAEWLIVAMSTGRSSAAAIVVMMVLPPMGFAMDFNVGLVCLGMSALSALRHKDNIKRLLAGTEDKMSFKWKK